MLESIQAAPAHLGQHLGHRGITGQITRNTRVLTKTRPDPPEPDQNAPRSGNPTATSEVPPTLPSSIARAACTTMKPWLVLRANPRSAAATPRATPHPLVGAPVISHHRIRPISGQHHPFGHPHQGIPQYSSCAATGLDSSSSRSPNRPAATTCNRRLHRQRRPPEPARHPRGIRHPSPHQRLDRPPIMPGDVMHHPHQHIPSPASGTSARSGISTLKSKR